MSAPTGMGGPAGASLAHDSARLHVSGAARYVDDLPEPRDLLHVQLGMSERAHARIAELDLAPVRTAPGVIAVISAADVPGRNDASPHLGDEPLFAADAVMARGQTLFAVAAESRGAARSALRFARVVYEDLPAATTIAEARATGLVIEPPSKLERGDPVAALAAAPHRLTGRFALGGQEHFYLEGQVALAIPGEGGDMVVHSSTQNPTEVQHIVARILGVPDHAVTVEVRRMGGAFGGKETQAAQVAAAAALVARVTGRPAKLRLDRDDDMISTGKRHDFEIEYDVGFDDLGRLLAVDFSLHARCGFSADLSRAVCDRAMFHADNAYFLPAVRIVSHRWRTHTVSNTAFRGFGGPQGMVAIEHVMDRVAHALGRDPLEVRTANLYDCAARSRTPYGQDVDGDAGRAIIEALAASSDYRERRAEIAGWNARNRWMKRGIALTPVKFGISFTATHLNQAGALIHVYGDGSIQLNHGGTEMGQGLMVKVAQVAAQEFGVPIDRVKIMATSTAKVPNTSPTAASAGSDLNGMAARDAAVKIKAAIAAAVAPGAPPEAVTFAEGRVNADGVSLSWEEAVARAYMARKPLFAAGFYATPKIHFDKASFTGRPFLYFAWGAAVSEAIIDLTTGETRILRTDILHDCGRSLNPAIDLGQIEGGFIQGLGWLTCEELVFDAEGRLRTHAPSTYKIPTAADRPADLRIALWDRPNREETIYRSKAVGEPPLMLAISAFAAIWDAVAAAGDGGAPPPLDAPATPERVLLAAQALQAGR